MGAELLAYYRRRKVEFAAAGDRLQFRDTAGVLTDDDRQALAEHRAELLAALQTEAEFAWLSDPAAAREHFTSDPQGKNLPDDSQLWRWLFQIHLDNGTPESPLYAALRCLRSLGGRLVDRGKRIELDRRAPDPATYAELRPVFAEHEIELRRLLGDLAMMDHTPAVDPLSELAGVWPG